jgi:hypothetical protein
VILLLEQEYAVNTQKMELSEHVKGPFRVVFGSLNIAMSAFNEV